MVTNGEKLQARPLFRKFALGMAIFLFLLAAVLGLALSDNNYNLKLLVGGTCVFVGFLWLRRALA
jgi:hypothetical protein